MTYLRLDNITKDFGRKRVLHDINLEIEEEAFCVLLGPSGCGKSTLLNIVAGLEPPTGGRVYLQGRDITGLPPHKRDMAMVFQNYALYPHLTVYENIAFGLRVQSIDKETIDRKVTDVSRTLNIEDKLQDYPRRLSGGERQRVAMGRAIVREPNVFLFDEPLSNLDARLRLELRKEFLQLRNRLKKASLYVTHDQMEALSLGDKIVVLKEGEIQQISPPQELYNEPHNLFVAGFIGMPPMNILELDVQDSRGTLLLTRNGFSFKAPEELAGKLKRQEHPSVFLGIRPAALVADEGEGSDPYAFEGEVRLQEMLGEDILVYIRLAEAVEIKATFGHRAWNEGTRRIRVRFPPDRMYFFDKQGQRLC
jgi:ABC-type sugar transport system ATPase subunit